MKRSSKTALNFFSPLFFNVIFLLLSLALWTANLLKQGTFTTPGGPMVWMKGAILLGTGWTVYFLATQSISAKGKMSFLGLFPLAWLALSHFQCSLCTAQSMINWFSVFLLLLLFIWIGKVNDGKILLIGLFPLWVLLVIFWKPALLLPLAFINATKGRFKNSLWTLWGGLSASLLLFGATRGWTYTHFDWLDLYDLIIGHEYITFALFAWLGWYGMSRRTTARFALGGILELMLGYLFFIPVFPTTLLMDSLSWVLVFSAGFGFEVLRKDLLDPSWHGQAVWVALGLAAFWGVF
jgi:hypothetical protein